MRSLLLFASLIVSTAAGAQTRTLFSPLPISPPDHGHFVELGAKGKARVLYVEDPVSWTICEGTHQQNDGKFTLWLERCADASADLQDRVTVTGPWKPHGLRQELAAEVLDLVFQNSLLKDHFVKGTEVSIHQFHGEQKSRIKILTFGVQGGLDQARRTIQKIIESVPHQPEPDSSGPDEGVKTHDI